MPNIKNKQNKFTVLIAEDNKLISKAFQAGLNNSGFNTIVAFNGEEAIEKIKKRKPNLILLDIMMPIKNGFEVLVEIKNDKILKLIPVVVLTNLEDDKYELQAKKLGADKYLLKANFSMEEVVKIIKDFSKI